MVMYLKNQAGYKQSYFKGMKYKEIRPIFEKVWDQTHTFVPMDSEDKEKDSEKKGSRKKSLARKRAGEKQSEESTKRQKIEDDVEKEELKAYLDLVPREEFAMEIESLATKYPIVDWKTHVLTENFMYYQIFRADGSFKNYKIFSEMLDDFDRQDVLDLHRLVKARYMTSSPEGYDLMLWGDLKILFEPDEEDEVWRNQHEYNLISWRLFDSCGIHILLMNNGIAIHMMIEKKYPLTQEMLSKMLSRKLGDHEMRWHFKLLGFIRSQYALDILTPDAIRFGGCLQIAVCLLHHSAVSYTSVTLIPSSRVFWGADEEISDGGPEEPQTPPVPQDEDEREPMFIQPHDPDYVPVPEPIYPEYIPLEDEHEFLAEEQPLPPVISPTAESPGYVVERIQKRIQMRDDADDEDKDEEDEDKEEEEEEEHLAPVDSAVVVPTVELISPPEGIEPVIPPPSTDITTTRAWITVRLQASISLLPEAEVERLLAMPTPPPSPPISLLPPSGGERLAKCTALSAYSSPPPALVDAVTAPLPSPPLPPLPPSLYIPPPVDRRDDIPKSERPPRKSSCLFALGSRYKVGESSTTRPTEVEGDTWVDPAEAVPEIAPMTIREVNTRVTELVELHEHDTQDLYALLEDAQDSRTRTSQRVAMDSQRVNLLMKDRIAHQETVLIVEEEAYASREAWAHAIGLSQAAYYELQTYREQQAEMAAFRETSIASRHIEGKDSLSDYCLLSGEAQSAVTASQSLADRRRGSDGLFGDYMILLCGAPKGNYFKSPIGFQLVDE
ncbi:hypothetical protein Tco_1006246 [Tanacetum coccineum]|uniref:Uncharacterized protein n=1 Tax=Tanacetum coccineum TaxID=301880 RepID=A0ABQ5FHF8_9ASTR